jgi:hypothetical protein
MPKKRMMKQCTCLILLLLFCLTIVAQKGAKKAVFIIVDGIPADVVEKVATPNLDAYCPKGALSKSICWGRDRRVFTNAYHFCCQLQ